MTRCRFPQGNRKNKIPKVKYFATLPTHLSERLTLGRLSAELDLPEEEIRNHIYSTVGLSLSDLLNERCVL